MLCQKLYISLRSKPKQDTMKTYRVTVQITAGGFKAINVKASNAKKAINKASIQGMVISIIELDK